MYNNSLRGVVRKVAVLWCFNRISFISNQMNDSQKSNGCKININPWSDRRVGLPRSFGGELAYQHTSTRSHRTLHGSSWLPCSRHHYHRSGSLRAGTCPRWRRVNFHYRSLGKEVLVLAFDTICPVVFRWLGLFL